MTDAQAPHTTNDAGIPAASDEHSLTAGPDGPILLQDHSGFPGAPLTTMRFRNIWLRHLGEGPVLWK